jgi:hypothetical protein
MNTPKKKFDNTESLKGQKTNLEDESVTDKRLNDDDDDDFDAPLDDIGGFDDLDTFDDEDDF